jgi:outer membrane protein assembly factor BamA
MIHQLIDKFYCFLFLFFISISINAQTIDNIEVSGNSDFTQSEYSNWINLKNQKYFASATDTINNRLSFNLQQNGYFNFQIGSVKSFFSSDSQRISFSVCVD